MKKIQLFLLNDVTGSMAPCFVQLRRNIITVGNGLSRDIPGLVLGVAALKDYCDDGSTYLYREQPFTPNFNQIHSFMEALSTGGGGDAPEAYEFGLHRAAELKWDKGAEKLLVLCGDEVPHEASYPGNKLKLDWRKEAEKLAKLGVKIFAVQCLGNRHATAFYRDLAKITGGLHITLDQFRHIDLLVRGVAYAAAGPESLGRFEETVKADHKGVLTYGIAHILDALAGRTTRDLTTLNGDLPDELEGFDVEPVPIGRFQAFDVVGEPSIKAFVQERGITFKKGRGFYPHVTRKETIQGYKLLVLEDLRTGRFFQGDGIREKLGIGTSDTRLDANPLPNFRLWVQSTSVNRVLRDPMFMYEAEEK